MAKKKNKKIGELILKQLEKERNTQKNKGKWNRANEIFYRKTIQGLTKIDFEPLINNHYKSEVEKEFPPLMNLYVYGTMKGLEKKSYFKRIKWSFLNELPKKFMEKIKSFKLASAKIITDGIKCKQCKKNFNEKGLILALLDKEINSLKECPGCHSLDTVPQRKIVVEEVRPETIQEEVEKEVRSAFQEFQRSLRLDRTYRLPHNWERDFGWYKLHNGGMSIRQIAKTELKNEQSRIKWENYIKRKEGISTNQELDKAEGSRWDLFTSVRSEGGHTPLENLIKKAISRIKKASNTRKKQV